MRMKRRKWKRVKLRAVDHELKYKDTLEGKGPLLHGRGTIPRHKWWSEGLLVIEYHGGMLLYFVTIIFVEVIGNLDKLNECGLWWK